MFSTPSASSPPSVSRGSPLTHAAHATATVSPPSSSPTGINAAQLAVEIQRLLQARLFRSAYILANFLLPRSTPHRPSPPSSSPASSSPDDPLPFFLFAESLNNAEVAEYRRALAYYKLALDALSLHSQPHPTLTATSIHLRTLDAFIALHDDDAALPLLESLLTSRFPTPLHPTHLLHLASLYTRQRRHGDAVKAYQHVLHAQPLCMEALLGLIALTNDDVTSAFPAELRVTHPSIESFLMAMFASSSSGGAMHVEAIHRLSALCLAHPLSAWLHVHYALVQQQWYDDDVSINTYQHAHELDRRMLHGMDMLALLLLTQRKRAKQLARLQHDALSASADQPEGWTIAALTALSSHHRDRCDRYMEKALSLNETHVTTHLVKACVLLHAEAYGGGGGGGGTPSPAALAFPALFHTWNLHLTMSPSSPSLHVLHPLCLSYLALSQPKKAFHLLQPHLKRNKSNPRLLTLLALTLSTPPTLPPSLVKAKEALTQAVAIDRYAFAAVMALSTAMAEEGRVEEAIAVLKRSCEGEAEGGTYVEGIVERLGAFHARKGDRGEALRWYAQTLRVNPSSKAALDGIKSIEEDVKVAEAVVLYR